MKVKERSIDGKKYCTCVSCNKLFLCFWHSTVMIGRPVPVGLGQRCGDCQEREDNERWTWKDAKNVNKEGK